jgi:Putative beta-barrel porin-2, OmpL-like. bbp2
MMAMTQVLALVCATAGVPLDVGGYVEANYQWNFRAPDNGITNFRGFDNRHNTFTLSNVVLDVTFDVADVVGKIALQVGHTPSTYYLAEPARTGSAGANSTNPELWKYIQQAYGGYRFDVLEGLTFAAGVFLSPIGPESMAVKDNWNLSRSNLFFGLPFYHTGARAILAIDNTWTSTIAVYNGWNSVVDNNTAKSVSAQLVYMRSRLTASMLVFSGVERDASWRHLLDAHATWSISRPGCRCSCTETPVLSKTPLARVHGSLALCTAACASSTTCSLSPRAATCFWSGRPKARRRFFGRRRGCRHRR